MNWPDVEQWANDKLAAARAKNDGDLDTVETAKLRGRIAALKELIALPEMLKSAKESQSLNGGPGY